MDEFTDMWTEWVESDDLQNQYKINYTEDGWYTGHFPPIEGFTQGWVYVVKEDELFFITVWKNDPRPQLKIMLGAAAHD